jgi:octaprenyl-diphosphate synthase
MITLAEIGRPVDGELRQVRAVINDCIGRQPREIRESLGYYFSSGGKFMRPLLALLCARAAAGESLPPHRAQDAVLFAAAVEFVHNASLVHDDIMDGDTVRRDLKTLHAKYGATCAVLLGDVLHITVFDLLGRIANRAAAALMTKTIRDMCYGQLLDVRRRKRTGAVYEKIIRYKTGALMAAACAGGALVSGAALSTTGVRDMGNYGMYAGMLYQMVDDYRDGDAGVPLTRAAIGRVAKRCTDCLAAAAPSPYRTKLRNFVDYVVSLAGQ